MASVSDVIKKLQEVEKQGYGHHEVRIAGCPKHPERILESSETSDNFVHVWDLLSVAAFRCKSTGDTLMLILGKCERDDESQEQTFTRN